MAGDDDDADLGQFDFGDDRLDDIYADAVGDQDSEYMRDLFREGWIDADISPDDRAQARDDFRDWLLDHDINFDDVFDWDDWRDWYENAA